MFETSSKKNDLENLEILLKRARDTLTSQEDKLANPEKNYSSQALALLFVPKGNQEHLSTVVIPALEAAIDRLKASSQDNYKDAIIKAHEDLLKQSQLEADQFGFIALLEKQDQIFRVL